MLFDWRSIGSVGNSTYASTEASERVAMEGAPTWLTPPAR